MLKKNYNNICYSDSFIYCISFENTYILFDKFLTGMVQENLLYDPSQFLPYDPSQEVIFPPELTVRKASSNILCLLIHQ